MSARPKGVYPCFREVTLTGECQSEPTAHALSEFSLAAECVAGALWTSRIPLNNGTSVFKEHAEGEPITTASVLNHAFSLAAAELW